MKRAAQASAPSELTAEKHPCAVFLFLFPRSEAATAPSMARKIVRVDELAPNALPPSWQSVLASAIYSLLERSSHIKY